MSELSRLRGSESIRNPRRRNDGVQQGPDRIPADLRDGDRKLKSITGTASHPCWWGAFLNKAGKILSSENPVFMVYSI
ncbi:MAG: hypothetical protein J6M64_01385 [Oscillospiraceae bacterium]|nr:hypothetical protein [Oscillospiraceae bacterium]